MCANATKVEISQVNGIIGQLDTRRLGTEMACGSCHTPDRADTQNEQFEAVATRLGAQVAELRPLLVSDGERQAVRTVEAGIAQWRTLYRQYLKLMTGRDYTGAHEVMLDRILW